MPISFFKKLINYSLSLFISACASISPPEGGEKDIKGPELISSTPENKSIKASGNTITLTFNEDVRLKDFNRQVIITPNPGNNLESTVDRNEVRLKFEKSFEPNTTYFLNFREGIEDITEGNKPTNLTLTFSTGTYLDSGQVKGVVYDLLTGVPAKDINVVLYAASDTTNIREDKPYYLTKTAEDGSYQLQNIKFGNYKLYAHQDKNNDNIYNDEKEKIAYLPENVTITAETPDQNLNLIRIDTQKPYITSKQPFTDEYQLNYNEGITKVSITGGNPTDLISLIGESPKIVRLFPDNNQIKGRYFINAADSSNNVKTDTLDLAFTGKKSRRNNNIQLVNKNTTVKQNTTIDLKFDAPLRLSEGQLFTLVEDSIVNKPLRYPQELKVNESKNILSFTLKTKLPKEIQIIPDTTKLIPISGDRFRKTPISLTVTEKEIGGSINLTIKTAYKKYFLELLDKDFKLIKSYDSPKSFVLENLEPNTYRFRVKIDEDENGTWREGNKDLVTLPEKIYHLPKPLEVKINWVIAETIEF